MMTAPRWKYAAVFVSLLALLTMLVPLQTAQADHTPAPTSVTVAGDLDSEIGCPGDWQPDCAAAQLVYDSNDDVWQKTFNLPLPASTPYEYKAALNGNWTENYGKNAAPGGSNVQLQNFTTAGAVKFYYDHKTHWITDNKSSVIATAAGSFQSELGCSSDWSPDCLRTWLEDPDGDGVYTFETTALPIGNYEFKVAINESWTENYGAGGVASGANIGFSVTKDAQPVFFSYNAATHAINVSVTGAPKGSLAKARAHWLSRDTIAWDVAGDPTNSYQLVSSTNAGLVLDGTGITGGTAVTLSYDPAGMSDELKAKYPYLASYNVFKLAAADVANVPNILKGQIAIQAKNNAGDLLDATELQIPGVLDDLFTYNGPLGPTYENSIPTLRLWAPTAQDVTLHVFADATTTTSTTVALNYDPASGVWSTTGDTGWNNQYYLYEVTVFTRATNTIVTHLVTDPYSLNLSQNSTRSQLVNLNNAALKPNGWDMASKPRLDAPEDMTLYELHIRDFSANDPTVPATEQGTFKAFTEQNSDGTRHLRALAKAGLTHVHLLPAFDCASINEDKSTWQQPDPALLATYPATSTLQQEAVKATRDQDAFNWCYDPFHYTVPEGSYSTDPNGTTRIMEFREMVQALNQDGLRVVMDVVYNHTNGSGESDTSVLDKVVPGYYHRLNLDGVVENSTCCQNTAAEHAMMEKLMVDSLVTWARDYKVDGFRFDLMGHHPLSTMIKIRDALQALTMAKDGVDGSKIYIYGEGWNYGEVENNARFVQASQLNLAGSGIGSFNDRIRDAVRGGGPFDVDQDLKKQGFINGLYYDPNDLPQGTPDEQKARLLLNEDQIRIGLTGNLRDFMFTDRTGATVKGSDVDYNGKPTGYTADPQEAINYDEAHDGYTLFDAIQLKAPAASTLDERIRMQNMGIDLIALSQGVPFFQAGQDLLRSKSFDPNSYNSGDWFNRIDWSMNSNNFGVGLPIDQDSTWGIFTPLLGNPALKPNQQQISFASNHFQEMLAIRASSPLFRLRTAADVQSQLSFLNSGPEQTPGLIVMQLVDPRALHIGNPYTRIVVLFNATTSTQQFTAASLAGQNLRLHPIQQSSVDETVRASSFDSGNGTFSVPARTTAVFVTSQHQLGLPITYQK